jgi:hypothetical protein
MKKYPLIGKGLAVGIILLFIGVTVAPRINSSVVKASNDNNSLKQEAHQDVLYNGNEKSEWKTNYFCRINVFVDGWCTPDLGIVFIRNAEIEGYIHYCRISGLQGTDVFTDGFITLQVEYLFGFTRFFWQSFFSTARMRGFGITCMYKVE